MRDDGENTCTFQPLLVSPQASARARLNDLALTLGEKSAASSVPPAIVGPLATLVTSVDCCYSNLIEGHDLDPSDIERVVRDECSAETEIRTLQLEARALVAAQQWIDREAIDGAEPFSSTTMCEVHRRFYELLPPELRIVDTGNGAAQMAVVPGTIRTSDVNVARHLAISPGAVPRFLTDMEQGYRSLGRIERVLSAACGHHRLLWVHPFMDGNGRVARLVSQAVLRSNLKTQSLWSMSRGFARRRGDYFRLLQSCDESLRDRAEVRAVSSEVALAGFAEFFLETCIEQVDFMRGLMERNQLRARLASWSQEKMRAGMLPPRSDAVLTALLYRGELGRAEVATVMQASERSARRLTAALIQSGIVHSETSRSPLRLAFPVAVAMRLFPGLLPGF